MAETEDLLATEEVQENSSDEAGPQDDQEDPVEPQEPNNMWTEIFVPTTPPAYIGPNRGPKVIAPNVISPLSWFQLLFDTSMQISIVKQTNLYQSQCAAETETEYPHERKWHTLTIKELNVFLGVAILHGVLGSTQVSRHWSTNPSLRNDRISAALPLRRFENILRFLHVSNNQTADKTDNIAKIRTLLDKLEANCRKCWSLGREISIDEMDVPFKGAHIGRERITYKNAGDGYLVYALCDSIGYVFSFLLKFDNKWNRNANGLSPVFSALWNLAMNIPTADKWHWVFADNLYSSVAVAEKLWAKQILFTCTARDNRIPASSKIPDNATHGQFKAVKKNMCLAITWKDRKVVKFLTTAHDMVRPAIAQRWRAAWAPQLNRLKRQIVDVEIINVAKDYNDNMNGVDLADQLRGSFNPQIRTRKWWHRFFWWSVTTAISNAYIMYKTHLATLNATTPHPNLKIFSHADFQVRLAEELIAAGHEDQNQNPSQQHPRKRKATAQPKDGGSHFVIKTPTNAKGQLCELECVFCSTKNRRKRTTNMCENCEVALCIVCFKPFHDQKVN
jgi:hypothetical protein